MFYCFELVSVLNSSGVITNNGWARARCVSPRKIYSYALAPEVHIVRVFYKVDRSAAQWVTWHATNHHKMLMRRWKSSRKYRFWRCFYIPRMMFMFNSLLPATFFARKNVQIFKDARWHLQNVNICESRRRCRRGDDSRTNDKQFYNFLPACIHIGRVNNNIVLSLAPCRRQPAAEEEKHACHHQRSRIAIAERIHRAKKKRVNKIVRTCTLRTWCIKHYSFTRGWASDLRAHIILVLGIMKRPKFF